MLILGILCIASSIYAVAVATGAASARPASVRGRLKALVAVPESKRVQKVKVDSQRSGVAGLITPRVLVRKIERNLLLGGRPEGWSVERVLLAKPIFTAVAVFLAISVLRTNTSPLVRLLVVGLVVVAYFAPDLLAYNHAIKRQLQIERELPDTLDQVTISIEAGLGFEAALDKAGQNGKGPLAEEFVRLIQDMNLGMSRRDAYQALANRTTVEDLRRFCKSIIQAEEQGVPISAVVRTQAKEMRIKRRARAEAKAQQVPVKILFPLMAFILPVLFIIVLGPPVTNAYRIN